MDEQTPEQKKKLEENMQQHDIPRLYEERDKAAIVAYIKNYIKLNGYVNTRYASGMAEPKVKKIFKDDQHRDAFYESISAMLVNTGEYTREPNSIKDKGYNILLNPAYFLNKSVIRSSNATAIVALMAFLLSVLTFAKECNKTDKVEIINLKEVTGTQEKQKEELLKIQASLQQSLEDNKRMSDKLSKIDSALRAKTSSK